MKQKRAFINIGVILIISLLFIMCKKDTQQGKEDKNDVDFVVYHMDTLNSDKLNKIKFEYTNSEFEGYSKRYLDIYYIIQDSLFKGELMELEKYQFGLLEDAKKTGIINIETFHEKGNKYVTFFVYDEVQVPVSKDSVDLKYVVTKFGSKTFIK